MSLPIEDIPAPGFKRVSGKRSPPKGIKFMVQFRSGIVDRKWLYEAHQMVWKNEGHDWDVVAVKAATTTTGA